MSRRELIKYISANSGENESWGNLVKKNKAELEQIYEYLVKINEFEGGDEDTFIPPIEETPIVPQPGEVEFEEDEDEDVKWGSPIGDLEDTSELDEAMKDKIDEIVEEVIEEVVEKLVVKPKVKNDGQEYVTIDKKPSALSASERKAFARTGRLPKVKKKINKYTRFNDEEVKFGF